MTCPLGHGLAATDLVAGNGPAGPFLDAHRLSPEHCLAVSRRHQADSLAPSTRERIAVWASVRRCERASSANHWPDGSRPGINAGDAAGQTIGHAHLHVVPRYRGDVTDPSGGMGPAVTPGGPGSVALFDLAPEIG